MGFQKKPKKMVGLAAASLKDRTMVAKMGGKASVASGKAYRWDRDAAARAGRLGGIMSAEARRKKKLEAQAVATPVAASE